MPQAHHVNCRIAIGSGDPHGVPTRRSQRSRFRWLMFNTHNIKKTQVQALAQFCKRVWHYILLPRRTIHSSLRLLRMPSQRSTWR